jgi:hypothetical protein
LYAEKYADFGPTLARGKLAGWSGDQGQHTQTALIACGLWKPEQQGIPFPAGEHFGELVQFDGSHHDWFEGRRGRCCLITLNDDATKTRMSQFFEEETMFGAMTALKRWIET